MSTPAFKLLSIVTIFEGAGPVEEALARFGIRGFTTWAARGRGAHGRRRGGILEADNQFYQVVTTPERAEQMLHFVETELVPLYASIAYVVDCHAVPADHFGETK